MINRENEICPENSCKSQVAGYKLKVKRQKSKGKRQKSKGKRQHFPIKVVGIHPAV